MIQWPVPSLCPGLWVGEEPETDIKEDKNTCFAWLETRYILLNHQNIDIVKQFANVTKNETTASIEKSYQNKMLK